MKNDHQSIPLRVVVRWEGDQTDGEPMTWLEFEDANRDGMEPERLREIRATVERGETFEGGGGAAPAYTVRRVGALVTQTGGRAGAESKEVGR